MTFEDAAAIPVNYLTAYHSMFTMGNLQPGDRILIHGAAGGVGIAAVQLARARGLVIFGTAGPAKQEYLRKIGVDHAIDYEKTDFVQAVHKFAPDGIEMVMDAIGGKSFSRSYQCLGPTGRLVIYGFSAAAGAKRKRNWLRGLTALLADAALSSAEADEPEHLRDRRESRQIAGPPRACCAAEMDEIFPPVRARERSSR